MNVEAATARYIDSLGAENLERAASYTAGNHWHLLWGLLVSALVTWLIVRCGVLDRLAERLKARGPALRSIEAEQQRGDEPVVAAVAVAAVRAPLGVDRQDLAGQRITKAIATIEAVEQAIAQLLRAWSDTEAGRGSSGAATENSLINGPRLDGDTGHADQSDIDRLFA